VSFDEDSVEFFLNSSELKLEIIQARDQEVKVSASTVNKISFRQVKFFQNASGQNLSDKLDVKERALRPFSCFFGCNIIEERLDS